MTYNLKYGSEDGTHAWSRRRPAMRDAIHGQDPDLIGTQEGLFRQLGDIAADQPAYAMIGQGREGGEKGEYSAIFYKKDRFRPLEHGDFWLSPTPEAVGSRAWGATLPRMVTWVLFEDIATSTRFYHFNTHFDNISPIARSRSADLLARRIAGRKLALPVIVTGDFNTDQTGSVHSMLAPNRVNATALVDSWMVAPEHEGQEVSSFHNWRGPDRGGKRIDWILTTEQFECRSARVVTFQSNGVWPSDHFPVVSDLWLNAPRESLAAAPQPVAALEPHESLSASAAK